jgi:hypothetical protein
VATIGCAKEAQDDTWEWAKDLLDNPFQLRVIDASKIRLSAGESFIDFIWE